MSPTALLAQSRDALEQWIARVEANGLYTIARDKLSIPLPADVATLAQRRYGDFSALNHRWNHTYSATTHERLEADPTEWYHYHTLYRKARAKWPEQPIEYIAGQLQARPDWRVGDFGCGECLLQEALPGVQVIGIDHVSCNERVIACDMAHTPLANSELDAAVFSLSLMGANWRDYLVEAARTLKPYGHLFIAEAATRWQGKQDDLVDALHAAGFTLLGTIEQRYDFLYLTTIKLPIGSKVQLPF
jgi:SAM-dependent methyltransferase